MGFKVDDFFDFKKMRDFEEQILYKVNGYKDYQAFYDDVSSSRFIKDVKIPTLYIHSLDDPVCVKECVPY